MTFTLWVLAGAVLGWASYRYLDMNAARGALASAVIGMLGGFFGGDVLTPMLRGATEAPGELSLLSMMAAVAGAAACLALANQMSKRFDI